MGDWARLPEGVGLSVYRIVQEALTNVVKHAAPARCRVTVVADEKEVRIEVLDDGPRRRTSPSDGSGHGLIGMRERVSMYGGTFEAGSRRGRGGSGFFATLPYGEVFVIRVVVADDQALIRGSFTVLVDSEPDLTVVGEAATGAEAVAVTLEQRPDVVLMDVRMPEMDGIEATRRIKDVSRVLVVTMFDLDAYVYDALRAGGPADSS
ncbi:hypothetical protein GCM10020001_071260 [Nonomuraea salmonea]